MKTWVLLVAASVPGFGVTLADGGRSSFTICAGEEPAVKFAARELTRFVAEMSGAKLVPGCKGPKLITLKTTPGLRLGPEAFLLETTARGVRIAGGGPRGVVYGVYTLLDKLGCRWFTREVSRIPKRRRIELAAMSERHEPAFEYREPFITEAFDKLWAVRNRTNGNRAELDAEVGGKVEYFPFVHSFNDLVPPKQYFASHPEYFSLIDGERRIERSQLCLTNPDVLRIAVNQVREWIREHPNVKILSVSQNDWEGWCECDRCKRVEQEEGGEHSGPILRFVNAVANEIAKTHPDKLIDTLAYWYSENPPAHVRPAPNVRIRLCPIGVCVAHPYESCPRSAYFLKNLRAWGAITKQLYIWHYNTNFAHYLAPMPDFDELAADLPLYRRNGVVGVFLEGSYANGGGGENAELRAYVLARQLWDPAVDVNREIDDFMDGVYGAAAKPMRAYFDLLHRQVRMAPGGLGQHLWIFNLPKFEPAFFTEADRLFDEALRTAAPGVKRQVEKARLAVDYMKVFGPRAYQVEDGDFAPRNLGLAKSVFAAFTARLESFGITSISEGKELAAVKADVDALREYRLVTLENPTWRVAIAPEMGGRIIRMFHKTAGGERLRIPAPGENGYPNLAGQQVQAAGDYPLRAWTGTWTGSRRAPTEAMLEGTFPNGIRVTRRIVLDGDWIRTTAEAVNAGSEPVTLVLQARSEFDPAGIDDARVEWRQRSKRLIETGEQPVGNETLSGENVPAGGRWSLERAGAPRIENSFDPALTARTSLHWTAKGGERAALAVWSHKRTLAPGQRLALVADYR